MKFFSREATNLPRLFKTAAVSRETLLEGQHRHTLFLGPKADCSDYVLAAAIGRWLFEAGYEDDLVLADVYESGIWPSDENLHLYYVWRRSHGNHDLLEEAPCHVFLFHEMHELISLVHLSLQSGWGIRCRARTFARGVEVDHDRHGLLVAGDAESLQKIVQLLK